MATLHQLPPSRAPGSGPAAPAVRDDAPRVVPDELPPLHVTTVGIPPDEHISVRESHRRERALWRESDRIAWLAGWMLLVLLGFFLVASAVPPQVSSSTPGATWSGWRAEERAATYPVVLSPSLASPFTGEAYAGLPRF